MVQTLRSYHDFTTSTIARDKEAIHSGGKNEASKSTGLIDKSVTRIDLIAWWHSRPREPGRLCTGFSSLAVPMHTTVLCRSKLDSRSRFIFLLLSSVLFPFVYQRLRFVLWLAVRSRISTRLWGNSRVQKRT